MGDVMKKSMLSILVILSLFMIIYRKDDTVVSQLNNKKIVIDPGHGSKDSGAKYGNLYEADLNLKISYALKKELESRGVTVYLTRTDEQDMTRRNYNYSKDDDMYLRAIQIDKYQPDLFVSIHLNSSSSSAWGSQVFYYEGSDEGKKLANAIHESMKEVTGTKKDISSCHFKILRTTKTLGALIECGFISNANERGQLKSKYYHKKLAKCISDGIEDYFYKI
jgi:N-acetylmuramoyl-L-alanine amidase